MSADNGIYILRTKNPDPNMGFEYRVAHAQAIESIDEPNIGGLYVFLIFNKAQVFTRLKDAETEALRIHHEISASDCRILEYGMQLLIRRGVFEDIVTDSIYRTLDLYYKNKG